MSENVDSVLASLTGPTPSQTTEAYWSDLTLITIYLCLRNPGGWYDANLVAIVNHYHAHGPITYTNVHSRP